MQSFRSEKSLARAGRRSVPVRVPRSAARSSIIGHLLPAVLAAAAIATPCAAAENTPRGAELERRLAGPDGAVMVVAHRACWQGTSENSIDAIEACIAAGIDMVELDVRATRDGKLVLMHDATVDRMTEGSGKVADLTWAELSKLHLREGKGGTAEQPTPLTSRRIPTFEQALRAAHDGVLINVDAKVVLSRSVLEAVDAAGSRKQILFKAEAPLEQVRELAPWVDEVRFMPILREPGIVSDPEGAIASYDAVHPVAYEIDVKNRPFASRLTAPIHVRCARYWVDSLAGRAFSDTDAVADPDAVWGRLIALGVGAIQTDEPVLLKKYLFQAGQPAFDCPAP